MKRRRPHKQPEISPKEEKPFFAKPGNVSKVQMKEEGFFQPKLVIGQPGDRFEQEADQMADAVVNRSRPSADDATAVRKKEKVQRQEEEEEAQPKLQRMEEEEEAQPKLQRMEEEEEAQPKLQRMEEEEEAQPKLQRMEEEEEAQPKLQRMEEEEEPVQAKAQSKQAGSSLQQRLAKNKGKGRQLAPQVQDKMENAFDADFSGVRVHTDQEAVQMNQELGAQAFTHGQDVYFNEGKLNPESSSGEHLLAHELTHVVQQNKKKP